MTTLAKADWIVPVGLLVLCVVPIWAGAFRIIQISSDANITAENARFLTSPLPVLLHIVCSIIYSVFGAIQFSPAFRTRNPNWHRLNGRMLVLAGLVVAISGVWMTLFYARATMNFDSPAIDVMRLLVGLGMVVFLLCGLTAACTGKFMNHRAWMMRAYALGLGAGTQVFTHIPLLVFPDLWGEISRAICMGAGWGINTAVTELVLRHERHSRSIKSEHPSPSPADITQPPSGLCKGPAISG